MVGECSRAALASPTIEGGAAVTSTSMSIVQRRWLAQTLVHNQIRPTSSGAAVDDTARIISPWIDCSKLFRASSRPAVLTQESFQIPPCFAFEPSIPQSSRPAALCLVVGGRGRVDNHSDWVSAFLAAKPAQLGNTIS